MHPIIPWNTNLLFVYDLSSSEHYQAFAAALPHHASLMNHLEAAQSQLSQARASLQEAKDALGNKRADLVQLWSRGQTIEEMVRILDQMYVYSPPSIVYNSLLSSSDHLKSVADVLETLISEKRFLQASVLLVRSLKTINRQDMLEIGAVADLRSYLNGQETVRLPIIDVIAKNKHISGVA